MSATHTKQRIEKLLAKGLPCASIAKKIGRPGDIDRIHVAGCNCPKEDGAMSRTTIIEVPGGLVRQLPCGSWRSKGWVGSHAAFRTFPTFAEAKSFADTLAPR
jgi:hypothetical protein